MPTAAAFLTRALAWFATQGIAVQRVYSDNGSCYRSHAHRAVIAARQLTHGFTRPYRPQTNGKAERFIQTLLREWASKAGITIGGNARGNAQSTVEIDRTR